MRIKEINEDFIRFDNGMVITDDHQQECCESNYADFEQIEDLAYNIDFDEELIFEKIDDCGFRFGSKDTPMFFVPCYSEQNGYYTADIDVYFNRKKIMNVFCERIID